MDFKPYQNTAAEWESVCPQTSDPSSWSLAWYNEWSLFPWNNSNITDDNRHPHKLLTSTRRCNHLL